MNAFTLLPLTLLRREYPIRPMPGSADRRFSSMPLFPELDRFFADLFSGELPRDAVRTPDPARTMLRPNLDVTGDDKQYFVTVELPGVDEKDLCVEVENSLLVIRGEKKYERRTEGPDAAEHTDETARAVAGDDQTAEQNAETGRDATTAPVARDTRNYYRIERSYGFFERALTLPEDVDPAGITAAHKDGVLTVTLPRKAVAQPENKRIPVIRV